MADDQFVSHDERDVAFHRDATGTALIYITTLILLVAIFLVQKSMADKFDAGMFGSGGAAAPAK